MTQTEITLQRIEQVLPQLPLRQLEMVLTFAEFVRERISAQSEDAALWSFVEREQVYRNAHPDEVSVYSSDEDLLAALNFEP